MRKDSEDATREGVLVLGKASLDTLERAETNKEDDFGKGSVPGHRRDAHGHQLPARRGLGAGLRGSRGAAAALEDSLRGGQGFGELITEFVEEDQKAERISELHSEYYAKLQERGHPLPGAKELITSLVERGYEVWLAASAKPKELEHHMKELGAEDNIAGFVSSDEAEESKPAPDIFGLALERAGVSPEEAVVVGDSIWDIEAAKEAGVRAAAVMTGVPSAAPSWRRPEPTRSTKIAESCSTTISPSS